MDIPTPKPALVIRYAYLWADEHAQGREEGSKGRPAAIVLATDDVLDDPTVVVLPITHTPPSAKADAIEIPAETKRRLGLDQDRSWIVLTEANVFHWPGPDLRPVAGRVPSTVAYGYLPGNFFQAVKMRYLALHAAGGARDIPRTE